MLVRFVALLALCNHAFSFMCTPGMQLETSSSKTSRRVWVEGALIASTAALVAPRISRAVVTAPASGLIKPAPSKAQLSEVKQAKSDFRSPLFRLIVCALRCGHGSVTGCDYKLIILRCLFLICAVAGSLCEASNRLVVEDSH
jgi:hypothetical protein